MTWKHAARGDGHLARGAPSAGPSGSRPPRRVALPAALALVSGLAACGSGGAQGAPAADSPSSSEAGGTGSADGEGSGDAAAQPEPGDGTGRRRHAGEGGDTSGDGGTDGGGSSGAGSDAASPTSAPVEQRDPKGADCPECIADFALYDPRGETDGVWSEEVTALVSLFDAYGFTYEKVDAAALVTGDLGEGEGRRYRALIAPGGWAWTRNQAVTPAGEEDLRRFVASGGNYVGFCAGAYWAADDVVFAEFAPTDYASYEYDLDLLPGPAKGPFAWAPWNGGTTISLQAAAIDTANPVMAAAKMPARTRFVYGGGPFFDDLSRVEGLEVWARAVAPEGTAPELRAGDGQPAIVRYHSGTGNVILFSYHPEVLVDSMVDGMVMSDYYPERTIAWDTGDQTQDEVNLDSWNIVHAALQVAANTDVTPLTSLPDA